MIAFVSRHAGRRKRGGRPVTPLRPYTARPLPTVSSHITAAANRTIGQGPPTAWTSGATCTELAGRGFLGGPRRWGRRLSAIRQLYRLSSYSEAPPWRRPRPRSSRGPQSAGRSLPKVLTVAEVDPPDHCLAARPALLLSNRSRSGCASGPPRPGLIEVARTATGPAGFRNWWHCRAFPRATRKCPHAGSARQKAVPAERMVAASNE